MAAKKQEKIKKTKTTKKSRESNKELFGKILHNVKDNIAGGSQNIQKGTTEVIGKVKKLASEAYEAGAGAVDSVGDKVHDYTEQQKLQKEQKELQVRKEELLMQFGEAVYNEYVKNESVSKKFLTTKRMSGLVDEIKELEKGMTKIKRQLS